MIHFLVMCIIGLSILFILIGIWIKCFIDVCFEKAEFILEIEKHNKEVGYRSRNK